MGRRGGGGGGGFKRGGEKKYKKKEQRKPAKKKAQNRAAGPRKRKDKPSRRRGVSHARVPGVLGVENSGVSCYYASVLQGVRSVLDERMLDEAPSHELLDVLRSLRGRPQDYAVYPHGIESLFSGAEGRRQQDAHEALTRLLDVTQLDRTVFHGHQLFTVTCSQCHSRSARVEPYSSLSLPLGRQPCERHRLVDLFRNMTHSETIMSYYCSYCCHEATVDPAWTARERVERYVNAILTEKLLRRYAVKHFGAWFPDLNVEWPREEIGTFLEKVWDSYVDDCLRSLGMPRGQKSIARKQVNRRARALLGLEDAAVLEGPAWLPKRVLGPATRECLLGKMPEALAIHISRFRMAQGEVVKAMDGVDFPYFLDLRPFCDPEALQSKAAAFFELAAVIVHAGSQMERGHYVAFAAYENRWYLFNDEDVVQVSTARVMKSNPYLLFYRPCSPKMQESRRRLLEEAASNYCENPKLVQAVLDYEGSSKEDSLSSRSSNEGSDGSDYESQDHNTNESDDDSS